MPKAYMVTAYRSIGKPEALAAIEGPGHREALRVLGKDAAERDMRLVEGVD